MTLETVNLVLSIGEIIGSTILLAYLWKKTDWKQEREFDRFMRFIDLKDYLNHDQNTDKVNPRSKSTPYRCHPD